MFKHQYRSMLFRYIIFQHYIRSVHKGNYDCEVSFQQNVNKIQGYKVFLLFNNISCFKQNKNKFLKNIIIQKIIQFINQIQFNQAFKSLHNITSHTLSFFFEQTSHTLSNKYKNCIEMLKISYILKQKYISKTTYICYIMKQIE